MSTFHTFGAQTFTLGTSISSTQTTILLTSFTEPVTGTPYTMALLNTDIVYATISPKTTSSEFISFTGITQNANGTTTLTGVTRGLAKKSPFTSDVAYKLPHSGQSQFIISDAPQVFEEYPVKSNDETITGQWTFDVFPITPSNSDASTTVKGVTKLSVAPVSATSPIAVGTNDGRIPVAYAVDSVGTDSYAITPSPAITSYIAGQTFTFQAGTANTGAATLNVSGLGAKTIKKNVTTDLATGDILINQVVFVKYDGTNMQLINQVPSLSPIVRTYNFSDSPATWSKPANLNYVIVELWAGGGSGGSGNSTAGGAGGGAYNRITLQVSDLSPTETVTIAAGGSAVTGSAGNIGGNSSFGSHITVYGGGGGTVTAGGGGGGGGGIRSAGATGTTTGGAGGSPAGGTGGNAAVGGANSGFGGGGGGDETFAGGEAAWGGGGGGGGSNSSSPGGNSVYGGGGGGGGTSGSANSGGTSIYGGNGGDGGDASPTPTAGSVPGGGGGGSLAAGTASGAGGNGRVVVTEYY